MTWIQLQGQTVKYSQGWEAKTRKFVESNYALHGSASALQSSSTNSGSQIERDELWLSMTTLLTSSY